MDVIVNSWMGTKRMKLAEALTPTISRVDDPLFQALELAKINSAMLGAMAAAMVEAGIWTLADAAKACGQPAGIVPVPTPTPAPPLSMSSEWKAKLSP